MLEQTEFKFDATNLDIMDPVDNGLFVFGIESPDSKKLIIEMYMIKKGGEINRTVNVVDR